MGIVDQTFYYYTSCFSLKDDVEHFLSPAVRLVEQVGEKQTLYRGVESVALRLKEKMQDMIWMRYFYCFGLAVKDDIVDVCYEGEHTRFDKGRKKRFAFREKASFRFGPEEKMMNIYLSVSEVEMPLPERVNFPAVIEICRFLDGRGKRFSLVVPVETERQVYVIFGPKESYIRERTWTGSSLVRLVVPQAKRIFQPR